MPVTPTLGKQQVQAQQATSQGWTLGDPLAGGDQLGASSLASGYYQGAGGYVYYFDAPTAGITISSGPSGAGSQLTPGSQAYSAVLYELTQIGAPNYSGGSTAASASSGSTGGSRFNSILSNLSNVASSAASAASSIAAARAANAAPAATYAPAPVAPVTTGGMTTTTKLVIGGVGLAAAIALAIALARRR